MKTCILEAGKSAMADTGFRVVGQTIWMIVALRRSIRIADPQTGSWLQVTNIRKIATSDGKQAFEISGDACEDPLLTALRASAA